MTEVELLAEAKAIATAAGFPAPGGITVNEDGEHHHAGLDYFTSTGETQLEVPRALLDDAPDEVLRGIVAHEIGHLADHGRWSIAGFLTLQFAANGFSAAGLAAVVAAAYALNDSLLFAALTIFLAVFATSLLALLAWARHKEYRADRFAAAAVGAETMADALRWLRARDSRIGKIEKFMLWPFLTHPYIGMRIKKLSGMPEAD